MSFDGTQHSALYSTHTFLTIYVRKEWVVIVIILYIKNIIYMAFVYIYIYIYINMSRSKLHKSN